ncbi:hypothetical protein [Flavobacterium sp. MK4S-17]|uniref:hypothetical protein n=1 Tax=Flavobacterium sp. MK4S-17 TaxID=2543737 RepID=UPI00135A5F01|nr:hypothetical protein [Flavobacterium sp. MK4S-17]
MQQIHFGIKLLIFAGIALMASSCNMLSFENLSNDFKWKNKKFKNQVEINFQYQPEVIAKLHKDVWFYDAEDSIGAEKKYKVKELLEKKLRKRNIVFNTSSEIALRLDTILFEEYSENITVTDADNEVIGDADKDTFIFRISGRLIKNDSVLFKIRAAHEQINEPRESYTIPGVIVMGAGGAANADRMIENAINEFSYRVYEKLKSLQ